MTRVRAWRDSGQWATGIVAWLSCTSEPLADSSATTVRTVEWAPTATGRVRRCWVRGASSELRHIALLAEETQVQPLPADPELAVQLAPRVMNRTATSVTG